jgi:hypothetical protein
MTRHRILVSRAAPPDVVAALKEGGTIVRAPVIRGVTVWEAGAPADRAVVVSPNWFGVHERDDLVAPLAMPVEHVQAPARRPDGCRYLVKALIQSPGVVAAHGIPETSVCIVLMPVDPARVLDAAEPPGGVTHAALPGFADLPGAVRFDVDPNTGRPLLARYAVRLAEAIRGEAAR